MPPRRRALAAHLKKPLVMGQRHYLVAFSPGRLPLSELTSAVQFFPLPSLPLGRKLPGDSDRVCLVRHHGPRVSTGGTQC